MPGSKDYKKFRNMYFKDNSGYYPDDDFAFRSAMARNDSMGILISIYPELAEEYTDAVTVLTNTFNPTGVNKGGLRNIAGGMRMTLKGGTIGAIQNVYNIMDKVKTAFKDIESTVPEDMPEMKDYIRMVSDGFFNTDYTSSYFDNMYLGVVPVLIASGPKFPTKVVNGKTVFDFAKIKNDLFKPDGKGFYVPYFNMCKYVCKLRELDKFKINAQKNNAWTEETEKKYLEDLKSALSGMADSFNSLKDTVKKYPGIYTPYLENDQDELTGNDARSVRSMNSLYGQIKGQIAAIDNGWNADDLCIPAYANEMVEGCKKTLMLNQHYYDTNTSDSQTLMEQIRNLQERQMKLQMQKASSNAPDPKLDEDINKLSTEIEDKKNKVQDKVQLIERYKKLVADNTQIHEKATALDNQIKNIKINSLSDKRKVLALIDKFHEDTNNLMYENNNSLYEAIFKDQFKKAFDLIRNSYDKGMDRYLYENSYASTRVDRLLNVYEPFDEDLPFTKMEMAYLSMAGVLYEKNIIRQNDIKRILEAPDQDFGNALIHNSKKFMENVYDYDGENNEDVEKYREVINYGRQNALDAMKQYVSGNKRIVAEMIYDTLYMCKMGWDNMIDQSTGFTHTYAVICTFNNLLKRDAELNLIFKEINASKDPAKRLDRDLLISMQNVAKIRLDAYESQQKLKALEEEAEQELQEVKNEIRQNEQNQQAQLHHEQVVQQQQQQEQIQQLEQLEQQQAQQRDELVDLSNEYPDTLPTDELTSRRLYAKSEEANRYIRNILIGTVAAMVMAKEMKAALRYIGTQEGVDEFIEFCDRANEEGLEFISKQDKLLMDGKPAMENLNFRKEFNRFISEASCKQIIKDLSTREYTKDEMREMTVDFMKNLYMSRKLNENRLTGTDIKFLDTDAAEYANYQDKHVAMDQAIREIADGMDFSSMSSAEFAQILEAGKNSLYETMCDMESMIDLQLWSNPEKRQHVQFKSLDEVTTGLSREDKFVFRGTKEYTDILNDLKKLNEDTKKAQQDFLTKGTYDGEGFARREKDLINRLDKYINRKTEELKTSNSNNSLHRKNAAVAARDALKERYELDRGMPTIKEDALENDILYTKYVTKEGEKYVSFDVRADQVALSGMEILNVEASENERHRLDAAMKLTEQNIDTPEMASVKNDFIMSIKKSLYYDMLKTAFGPNVNDSELKKRANDAKLKEKLGKEMDPQFEKFIDDVLKTKFGKEFINDALDTAKQNLSIEDMRGVLSQAGIVQLRDMHLVNCNKELKKSHSNIVAEMKDAKKRHQPNSHKMAKEKRDVVENKMQNLHNMAENLGSKALSEEKVKFNLMLQTRKSNEAAKKQQKQMLNNN